MIDKNKQFNRQNDYNRDNYDRVGLMLPKGQKSVLQAIAKEKGVSLNTLIYSALVEVYPDIEIHKADSSN